MAETLVSPGVLARENDNTFIQQQPVDAGAAIVGPAVKGPVEIPTLVSSYSDYQNRFGTTFESGSSEYTYLTSISAYNYFQNGGDSLLVTRVVSSSKDWGYASATVYGSSVESGVLETSADALLTSITVNPTDCVDSTFTGVALTGGTGTGAQATVVCAGNTITSITVTTAGTGYVVGDELTIVSGDLGTGQLINADDVTADSSLPTIGAFTTPTVVAQSSTSGTGAGATFTITGDGVNAISSVVVASIGTGYALNDTITITQADLITAGFTGALGDLVVTVSAVMLQNSTSAIISLDAGDIIDTAPIESFTLETLDKGVLFNNTSSLLSNGALDSGSKDSIRWEINSANTTSGTFSLIIRRGDDNSTSKVALETYPNLSLDPKSENYISKVIGDQTLAYNPATDKKYIEVSGSYPNASRYVRVKSVQGATLNYFNNAGEARSEFTGNIPVVGSGSYGGSFDGGVGSLIPTGHAANYYDAIDGTDTQGLVDGDYSDMLTLLANQDDYRYNLMLLPGLTDQSHSSPITKAISNAQSRGDHMVIVDPVNYASTQVQAKTEASLRDTSYAAMYWPWLRTIDPDSGENVWVPASTMMGGVFAFNDSASEPWFAPAGINRGGLGTVVQAERKLSATNRDDLYQANINPIASFPGTGVVVYGQKTLQKQSSALDRVNVRRLLIELKGYISQIGQNLVFEQNTAATRNNFLAQVNPYLESVQSRQGLYAFKVIMDESNNTPDVIDRNQLIGQIFIQPTRTAEFIYLDFNLQPTGASFPS